MGIAMSKPWQPLTLAGIERVAGHMGVYQLAGDDGAVHYIGCAGARSLHGLRGELLRWLGPSQGGGRASPEGDAGASVALSQYRIEITTAYTTRWLELLMEHVARHGVLPPGNPSTDARRLGRLSPS